MTIKDVFLFIGPLIAGLIGSYLTYYFTVKSKKKELILKFKEEKYTNLLILLQGFIGRTISAETKKKFFEEQYKSWLYSSDEVVKAINEMVRLFSESRGEKPDQKAGIKVVGNIVLAIRKDLLGETKLAFNDFVYTDVIE
ncbi:MAG: hypothetical protein K8S55_11990 [Phycisphaerae bacterium]|nr:hypothetical protein [Phycisphaerae bacterium]